MVQHNPSLSWGFQSDDRPSESPTHLITPYYESSLPDLAVLGAGAVLGFVAAAVILAVRSELARRFPAGALGTRR